MTDYEKLLEEADVTVRVLRASVPMVNADEAETIRRLAAALREVMADAAKSRALDEERFALFRGMQEQRDTALADVEAMRAVCDAGRSFVRAVAGPSRADDVADAVGVLEGALRALDARATPPASREGGR